MILVSPPLGSRFMRRSPGCRRRRRRRCRHEVEWRVESGNGGYLDVIAELESILSRSLRSKVALCRLPSEKIRAFEYLYRCYGPAISDIDDRRLGCLARLTQWHSTLHYDAPPTTTTATSH